MFKLKLQSIVTVGCDQELKPEYQIELYGVYTTTGDIFCTSLYPINQYFICTHSWSKKKLQP